MLWSTATASTLLDAVASTSVVALLTVISCLRPAIGSTSFWTPGGRGPTRRRVDAGVKPS